MPKNNASPLQGISSKDIPHGYQLVLTMNERTGQCEQKYEKVGGIDESLLTKEFFKKLLIKRAVEEGLIKDEYEGLTQSQRKRAKRAKQKAARKARKAAAEAEGSGSEKSGS